MAKVEPIKFPSRDGQQLAARFDAPVGRRLGLAIFAHCFTCSKDILAARRVSAGLANRGIGVLRFDFTGLGHSEGEFGNEGFTSNVEDLIAAATWLKDAYGPVDILVGHSLGGAAVLAAAGHIESVKGVATIGAPADPAHVGHLFSDSREAIESKGCATVTIAGREFDICKSFVDDLDGQEQARKIAELRRDLLVLHSPMDDVVGVENASEIFLAAKHPKSFVSLDKADHLLTKPADAEFAADVIAAWAGRILPPLPEVEVDEGKVLVEPLGDEMFPHLIAAGDHIVIADEPKSFGGSDTGLTPYQLLLAGLGVCTSMTMRMYAKRKNWPMQNIRIDLSHAKKHVEDCEACEDNPVKMDVIDRTITFGGSLDDEQRKRLMEIADKCPVHRTLESDIKIATHRVDD